MAARDAVADEAGRTPHRLRGPAARRRRVVAVDRRRRRQRLVEPPVAQAAPFEVARSRGVEHDRARRRRRPVEAGDRRLVLVAQEHAAAQPQLRGGAVGVRVEEDLGPDSDDLVVGRLAGRAGGARRALVAEHGAIQARPPVGHVVDDDLRARPAAAGTARAHRRRDGGAHRGAGHRQLRHPQPAAARRRLRAARGQAVAHPGPVRIVGLEGEVVGPDRVDDRDPQPLGEVAQLTGLHVDRVAGELGAVVARVVLAHALAEAVERGQRRAEQQQRDRHADEQLDERHAALIAQSHGVHRTGPRTLDSL